MISTDMRTNARPFRVLSSLLPFSTREVVYPSEPRAKQNEHCVEIQELFHAMDEQLSTSGAQSDLKVSLHVTLWLYLM